VPAVVTLVDVGVMPAAVTLADVGVMPVAVTLADIGVMPAAVTLVDVGVMPAAVTLIDLPAGAGCALPTIPEIGVILGVIAPSVTPVVPCAPGN
jgi:hypothetical protein